MISGPSKNLFPAEGHGLRKKCGEIRFEFPVVMVEFGNALSKGIGTGQSTGKALQNDFDGFWIAV